MKTSTIIGIVVVILIVLGAGYWWMQSRSVPAPVPQQGTTVNTNPNGHDYSPGNLLLGTDANASLGTYLIASDGMTLYTSDADRAGVSNCTGECEINWPPYTVASAGVLANIQAGIGGKAGTLERADGSLQVTYNGMPLYFWIGDAKSGDATGNGVNGFVVVKP